MRDDVLLHVSLDLLHFVRWKILLVRKGNHLLCVIMRGKVVRFQDLKRQRLALPHFVLGVKVKSRQKMIIFVFEQILNVPDRIGSVNAQFVWRVSICEKQWIVAVLEEYSEGERANSSRGSKK